MIQQIIEAFCAELQELFVDDPQTTVLRDTQFDTQETPSHTLPLVILGLADSPDVKQLSGGSTQAEWNWAVRVYFIDSNAELSPDQAFSTGSYAIIETIVNHLNFQQWLTQAFKDLFTSYSFKITFQDIAKAPDLIREGDGGIIPGYQIMYSSISIDTRTAFSVYSDVTLQDVAQVPYDTKVLSVAPGSLSFVKAGEAKTLAVTASTPWIIKSKPAWVSASIYDGVTSANVTITAVANPTTILRSGTIVFAAPLSGLPDVNVTVSQVGV